MVQVSATREVPNLKNSRRTREVVEEELRCCERLIGLLRDQRAAILGRALETLGQRTAQVDQELVHLEILRQHDEAAQPLSVVGGSSPPSALEQRLARTHDLLRLEGGITLELLTDLTICLDYFLQALHPPQPQCYDAQGRRQAGRGGDSRLNQEV